MLFPSCVPTTVIIKGLQQTNGLRRIPARCHGFCLPWADSKDCGRPPEHGMVSNVASIQKYMSGHWKKPWRKKPGFWKATRLILNFLAEKIHKKSIKSKHVKGWLGWLGVIEKCIFKSTQVTEDDWRCCTYGLVWCFQFWRKLEPENRQHRQLQVALALAKQFRTNGSEGIRKKACMSHPFT